ncbi:MAG: hypothetical protein E6767_16060 [Dysgonomonas sp.]|nr:hypothetical protein [Dysgonomonas sp.]
MLKKILIISICLSSFIACKKRDYLILKHVTSLENLEFSDTLKIFNGNNVIIGEYRDYGFLGEFKTRAFIIKNRINNSSLIYEFIKDDKSLDFQITDNFVYLVRSPNTNIDYGWFFFKDGEKNKLPHIVNILDSLEIHYKDANIAEKNGLISIYKEGKIVKEINYGDFVIKNQSLDSINRGLYKLEQKQLKLISLNADDLSNQIEGVYYVPKLINKPEYKYDIKSILTIVDSISELNKPLKKFLIYNSSK